MEKQDNSKIPAQSNERKIYPMTAELIDRAEANTVKNLEKYLNEERKKRTEAASQPKQFLHLFHEAYPPCDDYNKNRISYPYSIRIPDIEERIAFEDMLERDGFECVSHENGYPVVYVNFTLRRFGNAVKAVSSSSINRELLDKDSFLKNLYIPFMTNPTARSLLSNNYAQSAALELSGSINTLIINAKIHVESFSNYEKNKIKNDFLQIHKSNVTLLEPASDFRIEIKEGSDSSSYFYIQPVKVPESIINCVDDSKIIGSNDLFTIEAGDVECFLQYFLLKYFDADLIYNKNRREVLEDGYNNAFEWYLTQNYYTYETIEKLCKDILSTVDLLMFDYDNPALDEVKKDFSIYYMTYDDDPDHNNGSPDIIKKHIYVVVDFYLRFVYRIRQSMKNNPDFNLISFEGP